MLDGRGHGRPSARRRAQDADGVRLGAARGEEDLRRLYAHGPRDLGARDIDTALGLDPLAVQRRWVTKLLAKIGRKSVHHPRVDRRRGRMIEVHFPHMFGIYIHFPYCRKRCPFCDFAVAVRPRIPHQEYERAVLTELDARAALFPGRRAVSIYFGGGTPGLWRADCVGRVIGALVSRFGEPEEVTVECIPGELSAQHAAALRAAGVTRLSIGIESLDDAQLRALGRQHSAAQAREAIAHARAAGFASLSADLMFALPGQSVAAFQAELAAACALELEHLSLYQLTIEPGTQFARQGMRTSEGADHFMAAHGHMRAA